MNCPIHNVAFKTVPAGVSKSTGRPYNAFDACPERGCKEKPPKGYAAPHSNAPATYPSTNGPTPVFTKGADYSEVLERIAVALEKLANKDLESVPF